jgi:hypothetical protein
MLAGPPKFNITGMLGKANKCDEANHLRPRYFFTRRNYVRGPLLKANVEIGLFFLFF